MRPTRALTLAARSVVTGAVLRNVARAARRADPIRPAATDADLGTITVVVPARDEADRVGPLLGAVIGAPGVSQVLVVDDRSRDATAAVAAAAGADVVAGSPPPPGWAGKAWALQQGLDASSGSWTLFLDADTRPDRALPRALAARCRDDHLDLLTVGGRFDLPTAGLRWVHPSLLTTLVYRSPPPGALDQGPVHRRVGNGQCMVVRTSTLREAGGFGAVAHHTVEDVALVRAMAGAGFAVGFLDAGALLAVRAYETALEAWLGWGRSLALPGVDGRWRRSAGLGTIVVAQGLPLLRLIARRADLLDAVLIAVRLGTLAGTARTYRARGIAYWLSPLADPVAVAALVRSTWARPRPWRGRGGPALDLQRRASAKRRPTSVIRPPVAAVRTAPSTTSWITG